MSYLYKQFSKLIAKWPLEEGKCAERQFRYYLERELVKAFKIKTKDGELTEPLVENTHLCERRFKALESLYENKYLKNYPHTYKTGHMALNLEQLIKANSDEGRQRLGLRRAKKNSWFEAITKLWRRK